MSRRLPWTSLLLAAALLSPAAAQAKRVAPAVPVTDTLRLSLDEAIQRALARSEDMRTARANVKQTSGQVFQAASAALPQVSGSVVYGRKIESIYDNLGSMSSSSSDSGGGDEGMNEFIKMFASKNTWTTTLSAQQLIWSGGKVGAALRTARAANRAAQAKPAAGVSCRSRENWQIGG
jgi:outer membrane protein TolC